MFLTRKQMLTGFFVARVIEKEDEPGRCPAPLGKRLGPERVWGSRPLSSANGVAGHWGAHRTVNPTLIAVLVQFQPTPPIESEPAGVLAQTANLSEPEWACGSGPPLSVIILTRPYLELDASVPAGIVIIFVKHSIRP